MATDLRHHVPPSRYACERTTEDLALWFENRDRYIAQSAATVAGRRADLPRRATLDRTLRPAR